RYRHDQRRGHGPDHGRRGTRRSRAGDLRSLRFARLRTLAGRARDHAGAVGAHGSSIAEKLTFTSAPSQRVSAHSPLPMPSARRSSVRLPLMRVVPFAVSRANGTLVGTVLSFTCSSPCAM